MKQLKCFYRVFSAVLFWGIAALAVGLCTLRLFSFSPYMVLTGSMQPQYPIGSLVYVHAVANDTLKIGDAITFVSPNGEAVITHQIVAMDAEADSYYTKGIANDAWDASAVPYENIIGKVYFCIPYMGYLTVPLASRNGRLAVVLALGAVWAMVCMAKYLYLFILKNAEKKKTNNPLSQTNNNETVR